MRQIYFFRSIIEAPFAPIGLLSGKLLLLASSFYFLLGDLIIANLRALKLAASLIRSSILVFKSPVGSPTKDLVIGIFYFFLLSMETYG